LTATWALVNTTLQVALVLAACVAFGLAKKKRLKVHCLVMRISVAVEIVLIAALMVPSSAAYLRAWGGWSWFTTELIIHHILGILVILLFIFFNLVMTGAVKFRHRLLPYMQTAFVLWVATLAVGVHLYWHIWR
jgi:hypothetical protein